MVDLLAVVLIAGLVMFRITERPAGDPGPGDARSSSNSAVDRGARDVQVEIGAVSDAPSKAALAPLDEPMTESTGQREELVPATEETLEDAQVLGVAGRVVIVGETPTDSSPINGEIEATVWGERSGRPIKVPVTGGQFRLAFRSTGDGRLITLDGDHTISEDTAGLEVSFSEPDIAGTRAMLMAGPDGTPLGADEQRVPFGSETVTIYTTPAPLTRLNVVDRQAGTPLSGVKVIASRARGGRGIRHSKGVRFSTLTDDTESPVTLRPPPSFAESSSVHALVSADGYAWEPIILDLKHGADRTVELGQGGRLSVNIAGNPPKAAELRLYLDGTGAPISAIPASAKDPTVYECLAAGSYSVRVELGQWHDDRTELASQSVVIEANGDRSVDLDVGDVERAPRAAASGVLVIPTTWELSKFSATAKLLGPSSDGDSNRAHVRSGEFQGVPGQAGVYRFELPSMEVGTYEFCLEPIQWKAVYVLPPGGISDLRFELPHPAELTVHVIEAVTGEPVDVGHISWHPDWPEEAWGGSLASENVPVAPGVFRFQVVQGTIEVSTWEDGYRHTSKEVDSRTAGEVTLELVRACRVTVVLRGDGDVVPWPQGDFDVQSIDGGEGIQDSSGSSEGRHWFGVSEPGRYRLVVPEVNGYEAREPVEFAVAPGEHLDLEIELQGR